MMSTRTQKQTPIPVYDEAAAENLSNVKIFND